MVVPYFDYEDPRTRIPTVAAENAALVTAGRSSEVSTAPHRLPDTRPRWQHRLRRAPADPAADPPRNDCWFHQLHRLRRFGVPVVIPDGEPGLSGIDGEGYEENNLGGRFQEVGIDEDFADLPERHFVLILDDYYGKADEHGVGAHVYMVARINGELRVFDNSSGIDPRNIDIHTDTSIPFDQAALSAHVRERWVMYFERTPESLDPETETDRETPKYRPTRPIAEFPSEIAGRTKRIGAPFESRFVGESNEEPAQSLPEGVPGPVSAWNTPDSLERDPTAANSEDPDTVVFEVTDGRFDHADLTDEVVRQQIGELLPPASHGAGLLATARQILDLVGGRPGRYSVVVHRLETNGTPHLDVDVRAVTPFPDSVPNRVAGDFLAWGVPRSTALRDSGSSEIQPPTCRTPMRRMPPSPVPNSGTSPARPKQSVRSADPAPGDRTRPAGAGRGGPSCPGAPRRVTS